MSGLLDKKERILDYIVTDIGRSEMTKGEFEIAYAGFSDVDVIYEKDIDFDHTKQLLGFEVTSLPSDLVITDLENNGLILSTNMSAGQPARITQISTVSEISIRDFNNFVTGIAKPLQNHFLIGNRQQFSDRDEFIVSPTDVKLVVNRGTPINRYDKWTRNLNAVANIFQDDDFQTKANFKFMPPLNSDLSPVFEFDDITAMKYLRTSKEIIDKINSGEKQQVATVQFKETSEDNNIIIQFFEKSAASLNKLKIIAHESEDKQENSKVFFVGKTFKDVRGVESFIKMFTMVIYK